ncbi:MAG: M23 family metallopeptidase [Chloroflexi bacterium]|nr:M23 family metallopeptidase [Chloroflexota bacterium]
MSRFPDYHRSQPTRLSPYPAPLPKWRRFMSWLCLLAALCLSFAAVILVITAPPITQASEVAATPARATATAPRLPVTQIAEAPETAADSASLPTLSPAQIQTLLAAPPPPLDDAELETARLNYNPFTIIPNRARAKMTTYVAKRGDTISGISNRYGLKRESIAWCNSHELAQIVRPGDVVTIPPEDGACHTVLRAQGKDIRDIAEQYGVDDPYIIIDAPANNLPGVTPETLLPSNTFLFIPGGEGGFITWNAPVQQDAFGNVIAFDTGSRFSCGARSGGGAWWTNPLPNGTWVRGFYAGHSGIDIAAPLGTPIYAANAGPILYSGWNNWGYGNTVVIAHGPFSTLYGHMSSIAVRCGQSVDAGQVIGYVGSTGNSSGPHLHFEIRYLNQPRNPSATAGIGW